MRVRPPPGTPFLVMIMSEPIRMSFADPFFQPGIQSTIRVGTKWFESIAIGDHFKAHEPDSEKDIAVFEVVGLMKCLIEEIPNEILELNHDGRCNRLPGLLKILNECYTNVNLKTEVTVVLFLYVENCA